MERPTALWKWSCRVFTLQTVFLITSCAATQTLIEHRALEVTTNLSQTVFLEPAASHQKTIYFSVKNTSDKSFDLTPALKQALQTGGYRVVAEPRDAHYILQAHILRLAPMRLAATERVLGGGYGSVLAGGVGGAALGALSGNNRVALAGAVTGGALSLAADSLIKNSHYTMITDVQISERFKLEDALAARHRTRVVSHASQVNLSFDKARPVLEDGLVKTLAGIF